MRKLFFVWSVFAGVSLFAQVEEQRCARKTEESSENESDTTRFNIKNKQVIIVDRVDTVYAGPTKKRGYSEAHWAGLDYGYNVALNGAQRTNFEGYDYLENDPIHSVYFNLNLVEKKVKIIQEYFGLTSGIGLNFNQFALRNNYVLMDSVDTLICIISPQDYSKNKIRATYLQIPLLLEFNSDKDNSEGVYLAAGIVGGVRLTSRLKRMGKVDGVEFKEKIKGDYALNNFKLDATARLGFEDWGAFINYSLIPLFDTRKTTSVYPVSFGVSLNF